MFHGVAGLLIGAVGGYWVLERAYKQKGNLKSVGRAVGYIIIIVSLVGVGCKVWYIASGQYKCCLYGKAGKKLCPLRGKTALPNPGK